MVMPSKCPFCGKSIGDAEDHIGKCPKTYQGACYQFDKACRELSDALIDEVFKPITKIIKNTINEEGLMRKIFNKKKED